MSSSQLTGTSSNLFEQFYDWHKTNRLLKGDPSELRASDVQRIVSEVVGTSDTEFRIIGSSFEGLPIGIATIGTGTIEVLMWSQMHGDESTHTAVVLDLLDYLQRESTVDHVRAILSNCRLHIVPMLNPDGAARGTRRNAQGIDINRDARDNASPEGCLLAALVREISPSFAFNLHNQSPRRTIEGSGLVATASVMAPPLKPGTASTGSFEAAQKLATIVAKTVASKYPGQVGRYRADYMHRAFGEWVQSQGVATVLIEAGAVEGTPSELTTVHFATLLIAIHSIATKSFEDFNVAEYENIPLNAEHDRFDLLLKRATFDSRHSCRSEFDIGINFENQDRVCYEQGIRSRIVDLGDLSPQSGAEVIDCTGCQLMPGGIAFAPEVTPLQLPTNSEQEQLARKGVTTIVGQIVLQDCQHWDALERIHSDGFLLNLSFVISDSGAERLASQDILQQLQIARKFGLETMTSQPEFSRLEGTSCHLFCFSQTYKQLAIGSVANLAIYRVIDAEQDQQGELVALLVDGHDVLASNRVVDRPGRLVPTPPVASL